MATVKSFVQSLFSVSTPFTLQSLAGFPYSDWTNQQTRYADYENWYSGKALNEQIQDKQGNLIDKFPLKLNPIKNTCEKHASVLLGTTLESIRDEGVPISFISEGEDEEAGKAVNQALINAFRGGGGGSLFVSNGIVSQYLGGCVFGVAWKPGDEEHPVQTFAPLPTEFLGYPKGNNFWQLREAWFVREISWVDALAYGYPVPEMVRQAMMPTDVKNSGFNYYYIEHWTDDEYSIQVNDMVISNEVEGDKIPRSGTNPFGVVPFVYIPHIRTKTFLGDSIITDAVKGIVKEMNARNADIGDAVKDDSHSIIAVRGVRGAIKPAKLPDGRTAVDLGSAAGMGTGETDPDMFAVRTQSAAAPQMDFVSRLDTLYRVETKHPAVADGLDEGSQRSSLTLTTRMWPLQSHVEMERIEWTTGLLALAKIILIFCSIKGVDEISQEHLKVSLIVKWPTMLPRDREELINEVAIRKKNKLGSRKHLIQMLGDVSNVDQELEDIDKDMEKDAEMAVKSKPPTPNGDNGEESPDAANRVANEKSKE